MSAFQLTREQLQALMMRLHGIGPDSRVAMMGRLKHLQRLGWPPGSNTGKGKRVKYSADQVIQVALALEMIQLGLTPENTVWTMELHAEFIWPVVRTTAQARGKMKKPSLLMFDPAALSVALDSYQPAPERPIDGPDVLDEWVRGRRRCAVLNVTNLVTDMSKLLADLDFAKHGELELSLVGDAPTTPPKARLRR